MSRNCTRSAIASWSARRRARRPTKSGILLPDTSKERPQRGEVLAVGDGRLTDEGERIAMTLAVGDMVLFAKYGGTEFKLEDDELLILSEKDILAIVSE